MKLSHLYRIKNIIKSIEKVLRKYSKKLWPIYFLAILVVYLVTKFENGSSAAFVTTIPIAILGMGGVLHLKISRLIKLKIAYRTSRLDWSLFRLTILTMGVGFFIFIYLQWLGLAFYLFIPLLAIFSHFWNALTKLLGDLANWILKKIFKL